MPGRPTVVIAVGGVSAGTVAVGGQIGGELPNASITKKSLDVKTPSAKVAAGGKISGNLPDASITKNNLGVGGVSAGTVAVGGVSAGTLAPDVSLAKNSSLGIDTTMNVTQPVAAAQASGNKVEVQIKKAPI